ncbi:hypothetical protein BLOT_011931 [Blomia tropicalis]|nr:hypothetical protein BLOT_011931 [Blomia tropicalis]
MANSKTKIAFKHLDAIKSFHITNEREYYAVMFLMNQLTIQMAKYRLNETPQELLSWLEGPNKNEKPQE